MTWTNGATEIHEQVRGNVADLPPHYQASLAKFNQPDIALSGQGFSGPSSTPTIANDGPKTFLS